MSSHDYEPSSIERENLEAHVELCAERYKRMDERMGNIEKILGEIAGTMKADNKALVKAIVAASATIIAGLLSTLVVIMTKIH